MTEHTAEPETQDGCAPRPDRPRLSPRPLDRPEVDANSAAAFGRPHGVQGAFEVPPNGSTNGAAVRRASKPHAALATAYGRPDAAVAPLQRPPGPEHTNGKGESPFWDTGAAGDPWRNPDSTVG